MHCCYFSESSDNVFIFVIRSMCFRYLLTIIEFVSYSYRIRRNISELERAFQESPRKSSWQTNPKISNKRTRHQTRRVYGERRWCSIEKKLKTETLQASTKYPLKFGRLENLTAKMSGPVHIHRQQYLIYWKWCSHTDSMECDWWVVYHMQNLTLQIK